MHTPNIFTVFLNSANSDNASTPHVCRFDIGSVLNLAPNLINFQKQSYCKIKVRFFGIKATTATGEPLVDNTATLFKINVPQPNSLETVSKSATQSANVLSSQIIATIPTNDDDCTYSNGYYDNDYYYIANPFVGDIIITLTNQDGTNLVLDNGNPWCAMLEVCFDDNPARVNDNSGELNTKRIDYNLNGGYKY